MFNPASRGQRGHRIAALAQRALAARGVDVELRSTAREGGAAPVCERLAREGAERILVTGGDGTISEAADGVLRSGATPEVGFLPGGTGNSFLIDFGLTTVDAAAERIATASARRLDAGLARWAGGERHFVNVFGTGFLAKVCDFANRRLKWMGSAGYTWGVFPELLRLDAPPTRLTLDGVAQEGAFALVGVCNTIHTGGRMRIAPAARPDDGLFDVVALRRVSRARLLRLFPKIFDGSHVTEPDVLVARAREVVIEPATPSPLLGDGEVYGTTPVRVAMRERALRCLL